MKYPFPKYTTTLVLTIALSFSGLYWIASPSAIANEAGEIITKQKTLNLSFNEENPGGNVDLKKIVEDELQKPGECFEDMTVCYIKEVSFDITIKKEWHKFDINELGDQQFAQTVPRLENNIDELTKPETVVMQETLARRGLLMNLDGSIVSERGFFGSLTWLALIRLAQIKGLDPGDPLFHNFLKEQVNGLMDKMEKDDEYMSKHALPSINEMRPGTNDNLFDLWQKFFYLAQLAKNAKRVETGDISLGGGIDVNIDGFVNVERATR